jgi:two-component system NarL family sensor kinase
MQLKAKILLLAAVPLLLSLVLIGLAVLHQQRELATRSHQLVRAAYMQARQAELRHYVDLALSTLKPLLPDTPGQDANQQAQAIRELAGLDYGHDGYFFVYRLDGTVLMHSRQPELIGRNLWQLKDAQGRATIQELIAQARAGGGYVEYQWRKPSSGQMAPKLGYVVMLPQWGWMIGTGLYLDDIETTLGQLDQQVGANIRTTLGWITAIAGGGIALISVCALLLNLSEHREADAKLRLMARQVVQSQEDERAHLARELHDGTSQTLVAGKLLVETAVDQIEREGHVPPASLPQALSRINDALHEVRHLSHSLRPALLDTLGLPAALAHLGREFGEHARLQIDVHTEGPATELPDEVKTVLFRVTQEALTNVAKHAQARQVDVVLAFEPERIELSVNDDGHGFDPDAISQHPTLGIGLRNMRERLAAISGHFEVQSDTATTADSHSGTRVVASVPRPHPHTA